MDLGLSERRRNGKERFEYTIDDITEPYFLSKPEERQVRIRILIRINTLNYFENDEIKLEPQIFELGWQISQMFSVGFQNNS